MSRSLIVVISALLGLAGFGFGAGNPVDIVADVEELEPTNSELLEDDAPIVEDFFSDDMLIEETDSKSLLLDKFYNGLSSENIVSRIEVMYAPNVQFTNPFTSVAGRDKLLEHYKTLFINLKSFSLEITEEFVSGHETVLLWEISYAQSKLKSGEPLKTSGVSHLTFENDRVISQRDYFDAGAMVYEHVTLVGRIVKWVKNKVVGLR